MTRARQGLGRRGEALAAARLEALGYTLIERNYRCPAGEIDLVARHGEAWVFAEVKTRRGGAFGPPEAALTARKRRHLLAAGQTYLHEHGLAGVDWRIDVVAVVLDLGGAVTRLDVIQNAVQG